jgi:hypothetical protein
MKKIYKIIKIIIKIILIYVFINTLLGFMYFETDKEKFIEELERKYENHSCHGYYVRNGYLIMPAIYTFYWYDINRKIKVNENFKPKIEFTCEFRTTKEDFNEEIENIRSNIK